MGLTELGKKKQEKKLEAKALSDSWESRREAERVIREVLERVKKVMLAVDTVRIMASRLITPLQCTDLGKDEVT